jgi:hypothetical protein
MGEILHRAIEASVHAKTLSGDGIFELNRMVTFQGTVMILLRVVLKIMTTAQLNSEQTTHLLNTLEGFDETSLDYFIDVWSAVYGHETTLKEIFKNLDEE